METSRDRRRFLAGTLAAAGTAIWGCGAKRKEEELPGPTPPTRSYPAMPSAEVSIVGVKGMEAEAIHRAVREAIAAAGGLSEVERGSRVLIKPNMCGPAIHGRIPAGRITTHPEVLRAVIRLCRELGAAEILVSDRSMFWTELAMKSCGFEKVCRQEGAVAFPWTQAEYVRFYPQRRHWSRGFRFPQVLTEVDVFINVPVLKNHEAVPEADFTCCLKSFVGVCHPEDRHLGGEDELHDLRISEKIAELNLCAQPALNIVDATQIMVSGGPDGLNPRRSVWVDAALILASRDRVACDSVALAVLKRYASEQKVNLPYVSQSVWDQPQIYYGAELGIGQADPDMITLTDIGVSAFDEIRANWQ